MRAKSGRVAQAQANWEVETEESLGAGGGGQLAHGDKHKTLPQTSWKARTNTKVVICPLAHMYTSTYTYMQH